MNLPAFIQQLLETRMDSSAPLCFDDVDASIIQACSLAILEFRELVSLQTFQQLLDYSAKLETDRATSIATHFVEATTLLREVQSQPRSCLELSVCEEDTDAFRRETVNERLSDAAILDMLRRESIKIFNQLRSSNAPKSLTVEDIQNELFLYLLERGEQNYDPRKLSYSLYASMTVHYRGRRILSKLRQSSVRERSEVEFEFGEPAEETSALEVLAYSPEDYFSHTEKQKVSEEVVVALQLIDQHLSPFEKSLLYLRMFYNNKTDGIFAFSLEPEEELLDAKLRQLHHRPR